MYKYLKLKTYRDVDIFIKYFLTMHKQEIEKNLSEHNTKRTGYGGGKKHTPINPNTNYRREMKLIIINVDYFLLKFGALNFFRNLFSCEGLYLTFIFSM